MAQLFLIVLAVVIEFILSKYVLSVNVKEYQGFTTRFLSTEDDTISIQGIIFWIFISPVFSIIVYIIILLFNMIPDIHINYDKLWFITIFFWMLIYLLILVLGRVALVNKTFIAMITGSSILLNWYLSSISFTGNIRDILPDANNTVFQLYLVLGTFLIATIKLTYESDKYELRRAKFILKKITLYLARFDSLQILEGEKLCVALAILVLEDFERPNVIRLLEKIYHSPTRNIAQNNSIDDSHSVELLVKNIQEFYNSKEKAETEFERVTLFAFKYNKSKQYECDIWKIFLQIKNLISDKRVL